MNPLIHRIGTGFCWQNCLQYNIEGLVLAAQLGTLLAMDV